MEVTKTVQLKRTKIKERTNELVDLIDHAGDLDRQIKTLTKQLEELKGEIKGNYTSDIKEIHGGKYKVVFTERENWSIHPTDWMSWLKKNYTGKKLMELFGATVRVGVGDVRSSLGSSVVEVVGTRGDNTIAVSFKGRD